MNSAEEDPRVKQKARELKDAGKESADRLLREGEQKYDATKVRPMIHRYMRIYAAFNDQMCFVFNRQLGRIRSPTRGKRPTL